MKKAVKAQAQSSARPKRAAASKKASTKASTTAKKPAKKPAKKATAKKTKPKAKKKPAPKKKVVRKKVLTPEEKLRAQIRELRNTALRAPSTLNSVSAYNVFIAEGVKKQPKDVAGPEALKRVASQFKELTPAEREVCLRRQSSLYLLFADSS